MQTRHRRAMCFLMVIFMLFSVVKVATIDDAYAAEKETSVECLASSILSRDMVAPNSQLCTAEMLGSRTIVSHIRVGRRLLISNLSKISHIFMGNDIDCHCLSDGPYANALQDICKLDCEGILMNYIHNQDGEK